MDIRVNRTQSSTLGASASPAIDAMFVDECHADAPRIVIPRPELHLAVRFGPSISRGLDIHVLGARQRVTRKIVRDGQWTILARLQLVHAGAVLGTSPSALRGYVVPLEQVWGSAGAQCLYENLRTATDPADAAVVLERAIVGRLSPDNLYQRHSVLVFEAAKRLLNANVGVVAADLGISERHLRRVFLETAGVGPKTFVRLMRFSRATELAREKHHASWASIAVAVGYYDQAHLIEDFHFFAGTTPEAFRQELRKTGLLKSLDRRAPRGKFIQSAEC